MSFITSNCKTFTVLVFNCNEDYLTSHCSIYEQVSKSIGNDISLNLTKEILTICKQSAQHTKSNYYFGISASIECQRKPHFYYVKYATYTFTLIKTGIMYVAAEATNAYGNCLPPHEILQKTYQNLFSHKFLV